ncbi:MAG: hypothetical protein HC896_13790 [Bacteroidales bacterium]|nr:hypothetical protein [Bacteroidales bacterium]
MVNKYLSYFALFLSLSLAFYCNAQEEGIVVADGIIEYHNRIPLAMAKLELFDGSNLIKTDRTNIHGEYHFELKYNKLYRLVISKKRWW